MLEQGSKSRWSDFLFLALLMTFALLMISTFHHVVFANDADEGYYLRYAARVSAEGVSAFRPMFAEYVAERERWLYPNPMRVAFILLSALCMNIWGVSYKALAALSLCCYMGTLFISYHYCKKTFGSMTALLFSLLMAFSPLGMAMARRALVDAPANLFAAWSVWVFFDCIRERRSFLYGALTALLTASILMKEVMILLIPVFAACLLVRKYLVREEVCRRDFLAACVWPPILAFVLWGLFSGSPANVLNVIRIITSSPASNTYAIIYCSGPWYTYLVDFMALSPFVFLLAIGFVMSYFASSERNDAVSYFVTVFVAYLLALGFLAKNARYAMLLDTPLRLFATLMVIRIAGRNFSRHATGIAYLIVLVFAILGYMTFRCVFVEQGLYDPVTAFLFQALRIIPPDGLTIKY